MESGDNENHELDRRHANTTAVYCKYCQIDLNGTRTWEDRKIRERHERNVAKARQGKNAACSSTPLETKETVTEKEPEKKTEMWLWLENGKTNKEAEAKPWCGTELE